MSDEIIPDYTGSTFAIGDEIILCNLVETYENICSGQRRDGIGG